MSVILVSESIYGGHFKQEAIVSLAMSFIVNVGLYGGKYIPNNNLDNNITFQALLQAYSVNDSIILIGFDYDLMGQAMADTLEINLLRHNIKNFIRTPYFDDEYITVAEPFDMQDYYSFLYLNQNFMKKTKSSLKKVVSLEVLSTYKESDFLLDNESGNSTMTYITKTLLQEYR